MVCTACPRSYNSRSMNPLCPDCRTPEEPALRGGGHHVTSDESNLVHSFIHTTLNLKLVRDRHAPVMKRCRADKKKARNLLQRELHMHGDATCVAVGDQYVRLKMSNSRRAVTADTISAALRAVGNGVLEGGALADAANEMAAAVQAERTQVREMVSFSAKPERGGDTVLADPSRIEAAVGVYFAADAAEKEAKATENDDIGDLPAQLKLHTAAADEWLVAKNIDIGGCGQVVQPVHYMGISGGASLPYNVCRKESRTKETVTKQSLLAFAEKALRRARRNEFAAQHGGFRKALQGEFLRLVVDRAVQGVPPRHARQTRLAR